MVEAKMNFDGGLLLRHRGFVGDDLGEMHDGQFGALLALH